MHVCIKSRRPPEGRRFKLSMVSVRGSAVKEERIKKRRLCNWASKGDISHVRRRATTTLREDRNRDPSSLSWIPVIPRGRRTARGWLFTIGSVLSSPGMMMVCLVTAAAEKRSRAPPGNIAYNYVHRREDTHALWMRCAHTPLYVPPGKSCHRVG